MISGSQALGEQDGAAAASEAIGSAAMQDNVLGADHSPAAAVFRPRMRLTNREKGPIHSSGWIAGWR